MNFLIIIVLGVSIILLDESPKDLSTILEQNLICKPLNSNLCEGWDKS